MVGILSMVGSGELDAAGVEAAGLAFRSTNYQGFLYGNRHVIRDINAKGTPEVWSLTTDEYDVGHAAMEIECDRLEMQAAIRAYRALAAPVDHPEVVGVRIKDLETLEATVKLEAIGGGKSKYAEGRRHLAQKLLPVIDRLLTAVPLTADAAPAVRRMRIALDKYADDLPETSSAKRGAIREAAAFAERSALQPSDSPALEAGVAVDWRIYGGEDELRIDCKTVHITISGDGCGYAIRRGNEWLSGKFDLFLDPVEAAHEINAFAALATPAKESWK